MQKNALAALTHTNPTRAFELFQGMDPPEPAEDGSFPEDLRASGATTIFPAYWHSRGRKSLPNLRRESQHLGEAGEYPFLAVAEVLKELGPKNAGTTRSWIAEAVSYYRRGSRIKSADADFVYFIEEVQPLVSLPVLRDAVDGAVDRLLQKAEAGGSDSYTARLRTKGGFASFNNEADELIFELLPIVKSLDPDWARRLAERRPALRQGEVANGPIEQVESSFVRNLDEADSNKLHELGLQRSRLANIQTIASEKPEEALNLANTLTDTTLKSAALAAVAAGFATRQPERAVKIEKLAEDLIPGIENLAGKLRAWVAVGQAAASINDMETFHEALKKAFGIGEEVVQEDLELNLGKPVLLAQGYEDLSKLTKISARRDAQRTLSYISRLSSLPLQAYLLIDAADALFERSNGKQGALHDRTQ